MVAALLQLDHIPAVVAALPSLLLRLLQDLVRLFIRRTRAGAVPFIIAFTAYASLTTTTSTHLTTVPVTLDLVGSDPSSTFPAWTVNSVSGGKFVVFVVPGSLEVDIEQMIDVFQRDAI